ncbi:MAG: TetR/AcrR family transcriptional regulator [Saprospiraceae bacterium]|jgi:AcrR family transcriptional regulator|nr:TetR/AcrR family transcriptional regulator [Saprospiraceae bacterium]
MTNTLNSPKKQVIIETAAELFREKGFSATSIRDLAARVGLEPSSIYSHIKSKEELLVEICMPFAQYFTDGMHEIFTSDVSAKKKLRELIKLHLNAAYDHPASITVFNDEWRFMAGDQLKDFLEMRKDYEKKFKKILIEGKKSGKFEFDNVDIVFSFIIKTLNWSYDSVNKYIKIELEQQISSLLIKALS